jgi:hypothetical protein
MKRANNMNVDDEILINKEQLIGQVAVPRSFLEQIDRLFDIAVFTA